MDYTISSIPTVYKGRNYRSRLEAKWAAFFDLCGWRYEYEPVDLDGWFPDFVLFSDSGEVILVEVKPVIEFPKDDAEKMENAACAIDHELLILGNGVFDSGDNQDAECIGWLAENWPRGTTQNPTPGRYFVWGEAGFGKWSKSEKPGFCHSEQFYGDRISGEYDGGCWGSESSKVNAHELWAQACNVVQYRASDLQGETT